MLFSEVIEEYLLESKLRNHTEVTIIGKKATLYAFSRYLFKEYSVTQLEDIKKMYLKTYIAELLESGVKATSVNSYLTVFKPFFKYCKQEGYITVDPAATVALCKVEHHLYTVFSDEDIKKMLKEPSERQWYGVRRKTMLALLVDTGIRAAELRNLKVSDLRESSIYVQRGKGGKDRVIPLSVQLRKILMKYSRRREQYLNDKDMECEYLFFTSGTCKKIEHNSTIKEMVRSSAKRAGVSANVRACTHSLRHYYAIKSISLGTSIAQLSRNLGHSNTVVTQIYLRHITNDQLEKDALKNSHSPLSDL